MRILLTNDDGIEAPGMAALVQAATGLGDLTIIAPTTVRSATSHTVTFHKPIPVGPRTVRDSAGQVLFEGLAVDGHPADCLKLAVTHLLPTPVDLVISGINAGSNVGVNVLYSGTVGAAREAAIHGLPAIALSLHVGDPARIDWPAAAAIAGAVLKRLWRIPMAPSAILSVNIPILDGGRRPKGLKVAPVSTSPLDDAYDCFAGPDGLKHYKASAGFDFRRRDPRTDVEALFAGYITVSPLKVDPTDHAALADWTRRLSDA